MVFLCLFLTHINDVSLYLDQKILRKTQMPQQEQFFGTDGIRGRVGEPPITVEFILKLGWAIGSVIVKHGHNIVVIGKDTRISGYLIESAMQAGLAAAGCNVYLLGPMPTPAIAYLTRTFRARAGIVISASHNPYPDNGIKLFSSEGFKITKTFEEEINKTLREDLHTASCKELGKAFRINDAEGRYIEFCKSSIPHQTSFKGLKVAIDCANGSTYHIAPHVFAELGADVISINDSPNGTNINEKCGCTYPEAIKEAVLNHKADLGISFDGDGDRVLMIDHTGEVIDGDDILYIIAKGFVQRKLFFGGVVGTIMSNLGLQLALDDLGLAFVRVGVGDQQIVEKLIEKKWILGGEPSGHIICLNVNTTGDGIIAALQVLQAVKASGQSLRELKQGLIKFPQILTNVPTNKLEIDLDDPYITNAVKEAEELLGKRSRIVLRKSGTEPLIRIMVEGEDPELVHKVSVRLKNLITELVTHV